MQRAQQERQQAAAVAAAAAAQAAVQLPLGGGMPPGEQVPVVVPLAALVGGGQQQGLAAPTPEGPEAALVAATPSELPPMGAGHPVRHTRSLDPAVGGSGLLQGTPQSLPLASGASGRARRSPAGKPAAKPRAGKGLGPGMGPHGTPQHSGAQPDLAPFGEGYQAQGPSTSTPPKAWLLKMRDVKPALQSRLVQVRRVCCSRVRGGAGRCSRADAAMRPAPRCADILARRRALVAGGRAERVNRQPQLLAVL